MVHRGCFKRSATPIAKPGQADRQVFNEDINRLLKMDEMWKVHGRVKPVALDVESINDGSFITPPLRNAPPAPVASGPNAEKSGTNGAGPSSDTSVKQSTLKDQRELSVKDNLDLFVDR
jgi:ubiquitin-like 1-activating enzyme E1 B